ncbi:MAG: crossover junction endodeoxyribonuclease RuvC [Parasutterella sp.]
MSQKAVRILGIDPGLNHTGYGFVDFVPGHFTYVASGVLNVPAGELSDRLGFIFKSLSALIEEHHPNVASIEKNFLEYERSVQHAAVARKRRCDVCCRMSLYPMQRNQHSRDKKSP